MYQSYFFDTSINSILVGAVALFAFIMYSSLVGCAVRGTYTRRSIAIPAIVLGTLGLIGSIVGLVGFFVDEGIRPGVSIGPAPIVLVVTGLLILLFGIIQVVYENVAKNRQQYNA